MQAIIRRKFLIYSSLYLLNLLFLFIDHLRSRYELLKLNHLSYRSRPTCKKQPSVLSCARQDRRFPRNKIRAQLAIECKQMVSADGKMTDHVSIGGQCQRHLTKKNWLHGLER